MILSHLCPSCRQLTILLLAAACTLPAMAGTLVANIDGAKNDQGQVRCGLFADADGWRDETQAQATIDAPILNGAAVCDFGPVPPGRYALAVFHAEQGETAVRYGFLGKPEQGVGFSNNPSIALGPPSFDKAAFTLGDATLELPIHLRY